MASSKTAAATRICLLTCHQQLRPAVAGWIQALHDDLRRREVGLVLLSSDPRGIPGIPGLFVPFDMAACGAAFPPPATEVDGVTSWPGMAARLVALGQADRLAVGRGLLATQSLAGFVAARVRPEASLLWGNTSPLSHILRRALDDCARPTWHIERGFYPDTLMLECQGHAGQSDVHASFALSHAVDEAAGDASAFHALRDYVLHRAAGKYPQPAPAPEAELRQSAGVSSERLVLFLGQWDTLAGLVPSDSSERRRHSPAFGSTADALAAVASAARALGECRVVLKPHPNAPLRAADVPPDVPVWHDVNLHSAIRAADVVVGQVSTSIFDALLFDKPLVSLGRNLLSGRGVTYDCFTRDGVEATLGAALARADLPQRMARAATLMGWFARHYLIASNLDVPSVRPLADLAAFVAANALPADGVPAHSRVAELMALSRTTCARTA